MMCIRPSTMPSRKGSPIESGSSWRMAAERSVSPWNRKSDTNGLRGGKVYNVTLNPSNIEDANAAADLDVNDDLTIKRSGRGFAVLDAHGLNRVLDVGPAGSVSAKLNSIWVRHGFSTDGAGIRSGGPGNPPPGDDHLTLIHGRVTGSKAVGPPRGNGAGIESVGHGS